MPSCSASGPRVGILMLNSPNIPRYAHLATLVNYLYAARHGYGFMVARCPDAQDMGKDWAWDPANEYTFVWSKARMLQHALRTFDVVLFLDSDAIVWDFEVRVEDRVRELMPDADTCLVMAEDCRDRNYCWNKQAMNAGVILARASPKTSEILDHWMQPDKDCADWKYRHTREQACINVLRDKYYSAHVRKVAYSLMNGTDGTWVRHYMGRTSQEREKAIDEQLTRRLRDMRAVDAKPDAGRPEGFEPLGSGSVDTARVGTLLAALLVGCALGWLVRRATACKSR